MTVLLRFQSAFSPSTILIVAIAMVLVAVVVAVTALLLAGSVGSTPDGTMLAPFRWLTESSTTA